MWYSNSLAEIAVYFRLRADFLACERLCGATVFAGFAIKNSSGLWPSFLSAASHFGIAPLPAHVSPFRPRYFGGTFTALSDVREERFASPSRRCNWVSSSPFVAEHNSDVVTQLQKGINIHRLKLDMSLSHDFHSLRKSQSPNRRTHLECKQHLRRSTPSNLMERFST